MSNMQRLQALTLLAAGLIATSAHAQVVISQVYGGGGNSSAPYNHDFVELFNAGDAAFDLSGHSIQYASATGTGNFGSSDSQLVALPAVSLQPGQYFLVQLAGGSTGADLPAADASGSINMSGSAGKVALAQGTDTLGCNGGSAVCSPEQTARILDLVGFGSANFFEGSAAPATSNTVSAQRKNGGCTDSDNNAADFSTGAPVPRGTGSAFNVCSDAPPPPPPPPPPPAGTNVTIPEIEGNGLGSPLALGTPIVTEGVVTAVRSNGYFIQSAPGEQDNDPATSEGVFVFTGSAAPSGAVVGNRLRVTAKVSSYSRTPNGYPLTQLGSSSLEVLATGQPLPAPVVLGQSDLSASNGPGYLGRYLGMRVQMPMAQVINPTNEYGDLYVDLPGTPRPVREPGIGMLDAVPLPAGNAIPHFDLNPERLRVESTGLVGGTPLFVDDGTEVDGMSGVMYYDYGDFTLLIGDHSHLSVSGGMLPKPVPPAPGGAVRIGSYNVEFFGGGADIPPTRLNKLTDVFCNYLGTPDIVGLIEVADLATLQRLATSINTNEFGHCPRNPQYQARLLSNNGIQRLGYLISTAPVGDHPRVEVKGIEENFVADRLIAPDGSDNGLLFDRPPLLLHAIVHSGNRQSYPLTVLLNHDLSLLDVNSTATRADSWGTDGNRSRVKREREAEKVSQLVQEIESADPAGHLVLIGDFNSFDFSDGYVDVMGIISGHAAPADQVLLAGNSAVTHPLINLGQTVPADQSYSYVYAGNIQSLDHALVSQPVLDSGDVSLYHARLNADFAVDNADDDTVPMRTSDHDPLVAQIRVPQFLEADLQVGVKEPPGPVLSGQQVVVPVTVSNLGSDDALQTELDLLINLSPAQIQVDAPGWICGDPVVTATGSDVPCERIAPLASGASDTPQLQLLAGPSNRLNTVSVTARVATRSHESQSSNNRDSVMFRVISPRTR